MGNTKEGRAERRAKVAAHTPEEAVAKLRRAMLQGKG